MGVCEILIGCFYCGGGTTINTAFAGEKYCDWCGEVIGFVDTEERYMSYEVEEEEYEPLAPKAKN